MTKEGTKVRTRLSPLKSAYNSVLLLAKVLAPKLGWDWPDWVVRALLQSMITIVSAALHNRTVNRLTINNNLSLCRAHVPS